MAKFYDQRIRYQELFPGFLEFLVTQGFDPDEPVFVDAIFVTVWKMTQLDSPDFKFVAELRDPVWSQGENQWFLAVNRKYNKTSRWRISVNDLDEAKIADCRITRQRGFQQMVSSKKRTAAL